MVHWAITFLFAASFLLNHHPRLGLWLDFRIFSGRLWHRVCTRNFMVRHIVHFIQICQVMACSCEVFWSQKVGNTFRYLRIRDRLVNQVYLRHLHDFVLLLRKIPICPLDLGWSKIGEIGSSINGEIPQILLFLQDLGVWLFLFLPCLYLRCFYRILIWVLNLH